MGKTNSRGKLTKREMENIIIDQGVSVNTGKPYKVTLWDDNWIQWKIEYHMPDVWMEDSFMPLNMRKHSRENAEHIDTLSTQLIKSKKPTTKLRY